MRLQNVANPKKERTGGRPVEKRLCLYRLSLMYCATSASAGPLGIKPPNGILPVIGIITMSTSSIQSMHETFLHSDAVC